MTNVPRPRYAHSASFMLASVPLAPGLSFFQTKCAPMVLSGLIAAWRSPGRGDDSGLLRFLWGNQ
jgi:hypothetical protein